jgi:hypothetical protein|tara:strand:- start:4637 stop:4807 length:171 start_codon:yes stop_codon:yes gene_type:complete
MNKVEKLKEKNHITVPTLVNNRVQNILLAARHQAIVSLEASLAAKQKELKNEENKD